MTTPARTSLLKREAVLAQTGLGRSTLYALIQQNEFPRGIKLTGRAVAWSSLAVDAWIESRIAAGAQA